MTTFRKARKNLLITEAGPFYWNNTHFARRVLYFAFCGLYFTFPEECYSFFITLNENKGFRIKTHTSWHTVSDSILISIYYDRQ
jgi:hypothetical protein